MVPGHNPVDKVHYSTALPDVSSSLYYQIDDGGGIRTFLCYRCGEYVETKSVGKAVVSMRVYHDNMEICVQNLGHRLIALQAYIETNMLTRGDPVRL